MLALHVRSELADELGDPPPGWLWAAPSSRPRCGRRGLLRPRPARPAPPVRRDGRRHGSRPGRRRRRPQVEERLSGDAQQGQSRRRARLVVAGEPQGRAGRPPDRRGRRDRRRHRGVSVRQRRPPTADPHQRPHHDRARPHRPVARCFRIDVADRVGHDRSRMDVAAVHRRRDGSDGCRTPAIRRRTLRRVPPLGGRLRSEAARRRAARSVAEFRSARGPTMSRSGAETLRRVAADESAHDEMDTVQT